MSRKENEEVRINLLVTTELRKKYKLHCLESDISMSNRIRQLIEKDLKGEVK